MAKKKDSAVDKKTSTKTPSRINIRPIQKSIILVPIRGYGGPLVVHNWSQKAIMEMLVKQLGITVYSAREPKDPELEYKNSLYVATDGTYGFPITAIKSGMVKVVEEPKLKSRIKQAIFFEPDCEESREISFQYKEKGSEEVKTYTCQSQKQLFRINGSPRMRQDMVRIGSISKTADIRFRAEFLEWTALIEITYTDEIDAESIVNLIVRAGLVIGLGEGRPEKKTDMGWGRYEIDPARKIQTLKQPRKESK